MSTVFILDEALAVRLWDRLFDLYVMTPMQALTADLLRNENERDSFGVTQARQRLESSYDMIDLHLAGRAWVASDEFSMADCAAAPSLFYALTYVPLMQKHKHLAACFDRLMHHPSVVRAIDEAWPYFKF